MARLRLGDKILDLAAHQSRASAEWLKVCGGAGFGVGER